MYKKCPGCNNIISYEKRKNKFCSKSCSTSFSNKNRDKNVYKKSAASLKEFYSNMSNYKSPIKGILKKKREVKYCKNCDFHFLRILNSKELYCSKSCKKEYNKKHKLLGGYRQGSGRGKSGYYNGIWCDSSYELAWVIYNMDHNIPFERFKGSITNGEITYIPDFIQGNHITEIKGIHSEAVDNKTQLAKDNGYTISILYKEDLLDIFNYVSDKYNLSQERFYTLYDGHKPKYEYKCDCCGINFITENKRNTKTKFCSKSCSCKYNQKLRRKK